MYGKRKRSSKGSQGFAKRFKGRAGAALLPAGHRFGGAYRRSFPYRRTASQAFIRQPTGVPDRLYVKLVYREQLSWTTASGNLGDNVYRGNSIFDPDLTGTGGQPMGFDQWAAFYFSYTVLGSKIEVSSQINGGSAQTNRMGITPSNLSNAMTGHEAAEEAPYTKARRLIVGSGGANNASGGGDLTCYMSTAKMVGVKREAVQIEDAFGALVTANPTNTWFWHVWNYVPAGDTQSLYQNVKITYYVVFETRQVLGLS